MEMKVTSKMFHNNPFVPNGLKEGIILVLTFVFLVGLASAETCSSSDDVIFKIYSPVNAHAGTWESSYTDEICYSTFFGNYVGDTSTVHDCTAGNTVAWLYDITNSHVYANSDASHDVGICYGDLSCYFDSSAGLSCDDGESLVIATLTGTGETSAGEHAGDASAGYSVKICCNPTLGGEKYRWEDADGNPISSARVGDVVYAVARNYDGTADSSFDILENDPFFDDSIISDAEGSASGSDWRYEWTISMSDIQKSENGDYSQFFFKINGQSSGYLDISFCGDSQVDASYGETCDIPGDSCDSSYGESCSFCNSTCQIQFVSAPYCGDGVLQSSEEECDDGDANTNTCEFGADGTCSFCMVDTCEEWTIDNQTVYWTDMAGGIITEAALGSPVQMWYPDGSGKVSEGEQFHIFEDDSFLLFPSRDEITDVSGASDANGDYVGQWILDQAALDAAGDEDNYEFRFDIGDKTSGSLDVVSAGKGKPIEINLTSPACGSVVEVKNEVTIEFKVIDPDSAVNIEVTVDDAPAPFAYDPQMQGTQTIKHKFSTEGTKKIKVYADSSDDQSAIISNLIVVDPAVDGNYVAACVKEPKDFSYIDSDFVHFDATNSKVIEYKNGVANTNTYSVDDLLFSWSFSDGRTYSGRDAAHQKFYKYFQDYGEGSGAELTVSLNV